MSSVYNFFRPHAGNAIGARLLNMEQSPTDRRTMSRAATWRRAVVSLLTGHGGMIQATAIDISPDGLRVVAPVPVPLAAEVEVLLPARADHAADVPLTVTGRVVWCNPGPDAGHTLGIKLHEEAPPATDAAGMTRMEAEDLIARVREELRARAEAGGENLIRLTTLPVHEKPRRRWGRLLAALLFLFLLLWGSYAFMRRLDWRPRPVERAAPAPLNGPEALDEAQEALLNGDTVQATRRFEELIRRGPTPAIRLIASLGLADTLRQQGRAQEAIVALRRGLGAAGEAPKAWRDLARQFEGQLAAEGALADAPPLLVNALDLLPPTSAALATLPSQDEATKGTDAEQEMPARPLPITAESNAPPEAPVRLEVDASDYVLTVFRGESAVAAYPVGLGMNNATPRGDFVIANKIANPDWFNRGETVKSGDPRNPLGALWMGLGDKKGPTSYGIHPTKEAGSIGSGRSRGCVRMRPADALALYEMCPLGTPVHIRE